jgi:hypothetical protein
MKLKQQAAEQDALASKLSAQPDRDEDVGQKLAREMLDEHPSVDAGK